MIETKRLILRDYRSDDFPLVHAYDSLPHFSKYEPWGPNTPQDTKNFISRCILQSQQEPRYEYEYCICLKENDLLIGGCGIRRDTQASQVASIGYAINPDFQWRGFATEATAALLNFGFYSLNLHVIYATCDTRNIASRKVLERLGMECVGHLKDHRVIRGYMSDSYRYEAYGNHI